MSLPNLSYMVSVGQLRYISRPTKCPSTATRTRVIATSCRPRELWSCRLRGTFAIGRLRRNTVLLLRARRVRATTTRCSRRRSRPGGEAHPEHRLRQRHARLSYADALAQRQGQLRRVRPAGRHRQTRNSSRAAARRCARRVHAIDLNRTGWRSWTRGSRRSAAGRSRDARRRPARTSTSRPSRASCA